MILARLLTIALLSTLLPASSLLAQEPPTPDAVERITEIRVHGNHTTPDAQVIELSGLKVGDPASDERLDEAARAIRRADRFSDTEVLRRYLSLDDPSQVLVMLVVNEYAAVTEQHPMPSVVRRIGASTMWMPILGFEDGYGLTYGARVTFPEALGRQTRVSVPLTLGGERRAGVEAERWFGGFTDRRVSWLRLSGGVAAVRRVNPYYDIPDSRLEARARAEHPITSWLRVGTGVRTARVTFGSDVTRSRLHAFVADVIIDTRLDPAFPRNAIYLSLGREALRVRASGTSDATRSVGRWISDARGYVGLWGSAVLAIRGQMTTADTAVPAIEQSLLGGADSLRGYQAGWAAGDNMAALSTELRLPLTSPMNIGRFGVKGFVDWGTAWMHGQRLRDAEWERGIGGGIYFGGGPVVFDIAAAWSKQGTGRVHMGLGVSF